MNEELFEGLLKESLQKEQEIPIGLKPRRSKSGMSDEMLYVKILFLVSCCLIVLEQIVIVRIFFVSPTLFWIAAVGMVAVFAAISWILYLLKKEINEFIIKLMEVKKYESYN